MVSNSLTNRRRTARKPPVCNSGPPVGSILYPENAIQLKRTPLDKKLPGVTSIIVPRTGRCPPPPPPNEITCTLSPDDSGPWEVGEEYNFSWQACNPELPPLPMITPEITALIGTITSVESSENCSGGNTVNYTAPELPGSETLTMTVTFSNGTTCISVVTFNVTEEE